MVRTTVERTRTRVLIDNELLSIDSLRAASSRYRLSLNNDWYIPMDENAARSSKSF
jgi:hypothetical protein